MTERNLRSILDAMLKIRKIDQSQYFKNYLQEVKDRLRCVTEIDEYMVIEAVRGDLTAKTIINEHLRWIAREIGEYQARNEAVKVLACALTGSKGDEAEGFKKWLDESLEGMRYAEM